MKTREKIFKYILEKKKVAPREIVKHFGLSRQAIYNHFHVLLREDRIFKIGKKPDVFYLVKNPEKQEDFKIDKKKK